MQNIQQIKDGLQRYIDFDLCPGLPDLTQAIVGGTAELYIQRLPAMLERLQHSPAIEPLQIITDDGVDIESLYKAYAPRINKPVTIKLPIVGNMTFDRAEIDKVYNRLNGGQT